MLCRINSIAFILFYLATHTSYSQELFLLSEPASNVPKGVIGARFFTENYREVNLRRSLYGLRVMYGLTPRLTVMLTGSISNHHDRKLPRDLINHTHVGNQTNYFTQPIKRGVQYPYLFNGLYVYAKYRFISLDEKNKHLRVAAYGEWSNVGVAHDEAEPNLMDDTGGYGFGAIATILRNRFAASASAGIIRPNSYSEMYPDFTGGPDLPTKIYYGDAVRYNLSFGYRIYPDHYKDYNQVNWNVYVEFLGKKYDAAKVIQNNTEITTHTVALLDGSYLEIHPGIQRIVKSNLRIDFSVGLSLLGSTYVHFPPLWNLGVQRYFYSIDRSKRNKI